MTAIAIFHGKMSLEIALPHLIGKGFLKSNVSRCSGAALLGYQTVPVKYGIDGRICRDKQPLIFQHPFQLLGAYSGCLRRKAIIASVALSVLFGV
jgi:hypothetical protein